MSFCYRFSSAEKCVNCGWNMLKHGKLLKMSRSFFNVRAGELPAAERELLTSWLPKIENLEHLPVCIDCEDILSQLASEPRPVERRLGHRDVCVACGISVCRKRFNRITPEHEEFLREFMHQYQVGEKKLCHPCCSAVTHTLGKKRKEAHSFRTVLVQNKTDSDNKLVAEAEIDDLLPLKELKDRETTMSPDLTRKKAEVISLPLEYSNVREKRGECVACAEPGVRRLNLPTRQQLLLRHKIYVSTSARVCEHHRVANNWPTNQDKSENKFTGEEIADVVFLLKGIWPVDFGNVENIHRLILKRWIGSTLEDFEKLYQQNPVLRERADGKYALAVWLANKHTGECATVLASLSQRPRGMVAAAIKLVNECTQPQ